MKKQLLYRLIGLVIITWSILSLLFLSTNYAMWRNINSSAPFFTFAPVLFDRYIMYSKSVLFHFNWGYAFSGESAWQLLFDYMKPTLLIVFVSFGISVALGILFGWISAYFEHSLLDKMISFLTLVFASIPNYIWIMVFMLVFGYTLKWLPPIPPSAELGWGAQIQGLIMPVTALTLAPLAKFTSLIRNELIEALNSDYLLLLRTKGLTRKQIMLRHLLKDSLVAIMPELSTTFIFILSGSFLLERINNVHGLSLLLYRSLFAPMFDFYMLRIDIPVAVLVGTFYAWMGIMMTFIVDLLYPLVDPRIRIGSTQ